MSKPKLGRFTSIFLRNILPALIAGGGAGFYGGYQWKSKRNYTASTHNESSVIGNQKNINTNEYTNIPPGSDYFEASVVPLDYELQFNRNDSILFTKKLNEN